MTDLEPDFTKSDKRLIYERFMAGVSITDLAKAWFPNPMRGTRAAIEKIIREEIRHVNGENYD